MENYLNIAILDMYNNHPNEGMRCILQIIHAFLGEEQIRGNYKIYNVRAKNEFPVIQDYDIFISTGGPGSPHPVGEEWEKNYFQFLDDIYYHNKYNHTKKFLFLICHSFQMACIHWDLATVNKRRSTSFGVMPIHRTELGFHESIFEGLPEPFYAVDSRDYQVISPKYENLEKMGAKLLCLEKIRPHVDLERAIMCIRFTPEIFGTQFHPEADSVGMLHYFQTEEKRKLIIETHGEAKYKEMMERLDDPDKIKLTEATIIPNFLRNAAENLLGVVLSEVS
ncbi:MAG: GMP synthase [Microscillaceae bacterium]|nr:GMP synthase [Microscillaceae bacterium]MDW8460154.1 GMP synthase [Cytophagales bacterium]